jgi:hypothetical protein
MRYPELQLILSIGTMDLEIEAWLDTGFEGGVTIPASMEHDILANAGDSTIQLADGHRMRVPTWIGTVEIADAVFPCEVIALGNRMLLGLQVMDRMDVLFQGGARVRCCLPDGREFVQEYDR